MAMIAYRNMEELDRTTLSDEKVTDLITGAEIIGTDKWSKKHDLNLNPSLAAYAFAYTSFRDLQRDHYQAASQPAEFEGQQQDPTTDAIKVRKYRKAVHDTKRIIKTSDLSESEDIENEMQHYLTDDKDILVDIAFDRSELINVRAMATRIFVAMLQPSDDRSLQYACERLTHHKDPMIRNGALLGFADAGAWKMVKLFVDDSDSIVQEEAIEILDDMNI